MQLQELNDHFNGVNTDLLLYLARLCPNYSFSTFDKETLIHFAKYYLEDFSTSEFMAFED